MASVQKWLNESLKETKHELFKDVVSVEVEAELLGDGQVVVISETKRVNLTMKTSDGGKRLLKAISKTEADGGAGKQLASDTGAFTTETRMYSNVLKSMEKIMSDSGDKEYIWPDCYHCGDNKFIFQDLCEVGYSVVPTYKFLDIDHAVLVMNAIGKFHGLTMVLKQRGLLDSSDLKPPFFTLINPGMKKIQTNSIACFVDVIKNKWGPEWASVADRLENYFDNFNEKMRDHWISTKGKWDVLNHGDFSMRNMLFHYKPGNPKPDGIKFVDFQMCHYSNLSYDLATLLYTSLRPEVRDKNLEKLLELYTNSLVSTCRLHAYKGALPTVSDVHQSLKSLHLMTSNMVFFLIPFFIQSEREDMEEKTKEYLEQYSDSNDAPSTWIDYTDKNVENILKYELNRCMKENIF